MGTYSRHIIVHRHFSSKSLYTLSVANIGDRNYYTPFRGYISYRFLHSLFFLGGTAAIDERKVLEAPSQFIVFSKVENVVLKLKGIEYSQVNSD